MKTDMTQDEMQLVGKATHFCLWCALVCPPALLISSISCGVTAWFGTAKISIGITNFYILAKHSDNSVVIKRSTSLIASGFFS
jgi:hypothetical protein